MTAPASARQPVPLSDASLADVADLGVSVPKYDRTALAPRIVHVGVGGFHRAHFAMVCDRLAQMGGDWGICGVGLLERDAQMAEALLVQEHLYSLTIKDGGQRRTSVLGPLVDYRFGAGDGEPAVEAFAAPSTAIVSLTVTESGYDDEPGTRRTFDLIAAGLDRRRTAGAGGVTVLSCDNLPGNGAAARRCVTAAADRRDPALVTWVQDHCSFPNSMVDRITPRTSEADSEYLRATVGILDHAPVVSEPFWQWILEDDFVAGRPELEAAGVLLRNDVELWELYKLRLLNAGHSAIAYLSALAGFELVHEATTNEVIEGFLRRFLLEEAAVGLTEIPGHPIGEYVSVLVQRFQNSGVGDQITRLCVDGTAKFASFLMPTIEHQLDVNGSVSCSAHALAGWAHYLASTPEQERARDTSANRAVALAGLACQEPAAFVSVDAGFPDRLVGDPTFVCEFVHAHRSIAEKGALGSLQQCARSR